MKRKTATLFILLTSFFLLQSVSVAFSQATKQADTLNMMPDTSIYNELNEVVISATRVSQKIIDIPYSVVRVNYMNYRYDRKIGSNDVMPAIPGLFLQSRYGNHDVRFSIRGFGSRSNSGVRGVRILLDEIPESEPDGQTRLEAIDFNALSRIEVVKGNSSSLYTNAPGGVASFYNDIDFQRSSITSMNQIGSFNLYHNGIKAAVRSGNYGAMATYSYQNYGGYRAHNNEYWNIFNMVVEMEPTAHTSLNILWYYVKGKINLPGSLTKEEFDQDPWQADPRSIARDEMRETTKGRLGLRFNGEFGRQYNNEVEITVYGTIKNLERTAGNYRIINRDGFGLSGRYTNKAEIANRNNEFSVGVDLYSQPARIESYDNINGEKGDQLQQLEKENIGNQGFYISDNFEILKEKLFVLITGRYDYVNYRVIEQTAPSRGDTMNFSGFTPKLAFNYKLTPWMSAYTSIGLSFDSPANGEMESPDPEFLYNQDLQPQQSVNYELGIKGSKQRPDEAFLSNTLFEATFFYVDVNNEIVPYEVLGSEFYRNAAQTHRLGLELGAQAEIVKGLNFAMAYTLSSFHYQDYFAKTIEIDTAGQYIIDSVDFAGNAVPSVPKNNFYLSLSYSHNLFRHIDGFVKGSYMGISGMYVDDANTAKTDAYNLLNATLGLDMTFGKWSILLAGGIENITNLTYVGFTNTNSANHRYYEAGAPRNYYLTVNVGYTF